MSDWKIRKRKDGCSRCEREFEEEEVFYSFLLIDPESIGREDRCVACFDPTEVQEDVQGTIFWRTRRPPEGKRRLAVDFDVVEQIFGALAEHEQERILELRYLMSLLLLRKKRLKLVRVIRNDDGEAMVLRRPRRTEAIEVRVFDLSEERSLQLRQELTRIFEGADVEDLLAAPAPPPAEPAASEGDEAAEEAETDPDPETATGTEGEETPRAEATDDPDSEESPEITGEAADEGEPEVASAEAPEAPEEPEAASEEGGEAEISPKKGAKKASRVPKARKKARKKAKRKASAKTPAGSAGAVDSHEPEEQTAG